MTDSHDFTDTTQKIAKNANGDFKRKAGNNSSSKQQVRPTHCAPPHMKPKCLRHLWTPAPLRPLLTAQAPYNLAPSRFSGSYDVVQTSESRKKVFQSMSGPGFRSASQLRINEAASAHKRQALNPTANTFTPGKVTSIPTPSAPSKDSLERENRQRCEKSGLTYSKHFHSGAHSFSPAKYHAKVYESSDQTDTRKGAPHKSDGRTKPFTLEAAYKFIIHDFASNPVGGVEASREEKVSTFFRYNLSRKKYQEYKRAICAAHAQSEEPSSDHWTRSRIDQGTFEAVCCGMISSSWKALSAKLPTQQDWDRATRRALDQIENVRLDLLVKDAFDGTIFDSTARHVPTHSDAIQQLELPNLDKVSASNSTAQPPE